MPNPSTLPAYPWHRACPVCTADDARSLLDNRMAPLDGLDMSYRVSRCGHCGFHFASDLPHPDTYSAYYRALSKYDVIIGSTVVSPTTNSRIRRTLELCTPYLPQNALIVDIGCGFGALLNAFREAGFPRVHGIDPALHSAFEAARLFGLRDVHVGTLPEAPARLPLAKADLLCLTGVAEHLPQLADDLALLLAQLPAQAMALIEVPSQERFLSPPCEPYGEFSLEHIQYFSTRALCDLMARSGFFPRTLSILPCQGCTDSLFGLFSRNGDGADATKMPPAADLDAYLAYSATGLDQALSRLAETTRQPFILFGAGSHTARLIPQLERLGLATGVLALVDNNPNLQGKELGGFTIQDSSLLARYPDTPVLISSFHAQNVIARQLAGRHPTILLYEAGP